MRKLVSTALAALVFIAPGAACSSSQPYTRGVVFTAPITGMVRYNGALAPTTLLVEIKDTTNRSSQKIVALNGRYNARGIVGHSYLVRVIGLNRNCFSNWSAPVPIRHVALNTIVDYGCYI